MALHFEVLFSKSELAHLKKISITMITNNSSTSLFDSQSVLDGLSVGLVLIDEKGKITLVNKKLAEDFNWDINSLKNVSIKDICPYYNEINWQTEWTSLTQAKVSVRNTEMITELGFYFPVQITFSLVKQGGKDVLFGIIRNLSDIRREELIIDSDSGAIYIRKK